MHGAQILFLSGNKIPHAIAKSLHATTKTCHTKYINKNYKINIFKICSGIGDFAHDNLTSGASLVAQIVKTLAAMQETWV